MNRTDLLLLLGLTPLAGCGGGIATPTVRAPSAQSTNSYAGSFNADKTIATITQNGAWAVTTDASKAGSLAVTQAGGSTTIPIPLDLSLGTHNTALGAYTIISANDATVGDIDVRVTGSSITLSQGGREHVIDLSMLTRRVEGEIGTALGIAALGTAIAVATLAAPLIAATAVIVTMVGIAAATL